MVSHIILTVSISAADRTRATEEYFECVCVCMCVCVHVCVCVCVCACTCMLNLGGFDVLLFACQVSYHK